MTDYFALLGQPRSPWLDADELKARFLALSSAVHPDRTHGASEAEKSTAHQRYVELNSAYQVLRDTKDRVLHLLELETGPHKQSVQQVPPDLSDLFFRISAVFREVDNLLKTPVTSPLLKAETFETSQAFVEQLQSLQATINSKQAGFEDELKGFAADWCGGHERDPLIGRLDQIAQQLSYCKRWTSQIQDRLVRLAS